MNTSFIAYIDESGDEGFVFHPDGSGSSRWFILSAAVIRRSNDLQMVSCLNETRLILRKPPKTALHFVDLKHEQRVPYIRRVGALPIRTVSMLVHKPQITEPEKFQNTKFLLYRNATRLPFGADLLALQGSATARRGRRIRRGDLFQSKYHVLRRDSLVSPPAAEAIGEQSAERAD